MLLNKIIRFLFILLLGITPLYSIESLRLTDVIKSNGTGQINLLKDLSASQLEQYRMDNNGAIIIGIDINEAANGTEKSTTQAVTIKTLIFNIELDDGSSYTYQVFSTETQVTVAEVNSTERHTYYTALGDAGSNRITSSNSIQNIFDSTIKIDLPIDLSSAITAEINIILLDTNVSLGDPEAFYDYSNGFEDLAILNQSDSLYLDQLAPGRDEAPAVELSNPEDETDFDVSSTLFYPSATDYYTIAYEDLFPSKGDYDFNDLVIAYKILFHLNSSNKLVKISGESVILAKGASFDHDWNLKIDLPSSASGTFTCNIQFPPSDERTPLFQSKSITGSLNESIFSNTQNLYPHFNTFVGENFNKGARATFSLELDSTVPLTQVSNAPFDAYLFVHDTQFEIHRSEYQASPESYNVTQGKTSFLDENGFPFAMLLPTLWKFPYENRDLGEAYPDLIQYLLSGSTNYLDWYNNPNTEKVKSYLSQDYLWWEE